MLYTRDGGCDFGLMWVYEIVAEKFRREGEEWELNGRFEYTAQDALEGVGLANIAEVGGVGAVNGSLAITAKEAGGGEVTDIFQTLFLEAGKDFAESSLALFVALAFGFNEESVLVVAILDEDNGGSGAGAAQFFDQGPGSFAHLSGDDIGQAIDDVDGGVELGEQAGDFDFHAAVAGEAEIDDFAVEATAEDRSVRHASA